MKTKFLFLLPAFFCTVVVSAQQPSPSCDAPDLVRKHYSGDASIVALRLMQNDPQWADSVLIPASLYEPAMDALIAVHNALQYPERDTVVECFDIHAFPYPHPISILMSVDSSTTWAKNLHNDIFPTGDSLVDDLFFTHQLHKSYSFLGSKFFIWVDAAQPLNTTALAKRFENAPGIISVNPASPIGDGNDIVYQSTNNNVELTYTVGWGDCPAGCIFDRNWKFSVMPDCSVSFIGAWGDAINPGIGCNNLYQCAVEPLCLQWLRDTIQYYTDAFPNCSPPYQSVYLTQYQQFGSPVILGIHVFIGFDYEFTRFYYCNGDFIGQCTTTILGLMCTPPSLTDYIDSDTIWDCSMPLPPVALCGVSAVPEVAAGKGFHIVPNPASGLVLITAAFEKQEQGRLLVFDLYGRVVWEKQFKSVEFAEEIDLQGKSPGVYLVSIETGEKIWTRKLVLSNR